MLKRSFCVITSIIWCLDICTDLAPARARSTPTTVDLKLAIDRFFKTGVLDESWFALKEMKSPEKFTGFRKQALDARNIAFTLFGAYKQVHCQSKTSYIATVDRRELAIEFKIDDRGRITALSAK